VPGHFGKTRDSAELHSSLALGNGVIRHCPWFLRFLIGFFQHRHPGLRCPPPLPPFAVQKRRCFQPGVRSRTRPRVLRRPFNPGKPVGKPVSLNWGNGDGTFPSLPAFQRAEQPFSWSHRNQIFLPFSFSSLQAPPPPSPFPQCYFQIGKQPCASPAATRFSSWPGCVALRWYRTPGAIKPYGGH